MISQNTKINLLVLLFFSLITVIITWPLISHLTTLIIDPYDSLLINWIINWSIHHPFDLNTTIFYPFKNTLAYSDFHLISAITAAPFVLIFKEPLLGFNINFLLGFSLTGFFTYLLTKHITSDTKVSLFSGVLFSFGMIHVNYHDHLQLLGFWPFILTVYLFLKKKNILFVVFFFLSVATMPLFFFFFLITFICYFLFLGNRKEIPLLLTAFILSGFIFIPYLLVSREFNYVRPINDTIHFSLKFYDFFVVNQNSRLSLFTGLITLVLLPITIYYSLKNKTKTSIFFLSLLIVSFILAFGPFFHVFKDTVRVGPIPGLPLPYLFFYYLVPGFSGFRTPSRWILLAFFALCLLFAYTFKRKINPKIIGLLILIVILEVNFPFNYSSIPKLNEFPDEVVWLKSNLKDSSIIQFPIYGWFDGKKIGVETLRMHYSISHGHKMYNGFSGFSPKTWESDVQWLQKDFPSKETIKYLQNRNIELVLVPLSRKGKIEKFKEDFTLVYQNNTVLIYKLSKE